MSLLVLSSQPISLAATALTRVMTQIRNTASWLSVCERCFSGSGISTIIKRRESSNIPAIFVPGTSAIQQKKVATPKTAPPRPIFPMPFRCMRRKNTPMVITLNKAIKAIVWRASGSSSKAILWALPPFSAVATTYMVSSASHVFPMKCSGIFPRTSMSPIWERFPEAKSLNAFSAWWSEYTLASIQRGLRIFLSPSFVMTSTSLLSSKIVFVLGPSKHHLRSWYDTPAAATL